MFDPLYPPGLQWYWRADWVKEMSDEAIAVHVKYAAELPNTAFHHASVPDQWRAQASRQERDGLQLSRCQLGQVIVGVDPDPANNERMIFMGKGLL